MWANSWQPQTSPRSTLGSVTRSSVSFLFTHWSFLWHGRGDTSPVLGDTLSSPPVSVHSPHTLYSFPVVLGSPSSSLTALCSWASPSAQKPLPVQISQLGISSDKLCWLIQGVPHLLLLPPFVFQSWGFHSLTGWFAVTPYSSCNNGSPWWHWISDLSLVQGHNFYHFAKW